MDVGNADIVRSNISVHTIVLLVEMTVHLKLKWQRQKCPAISFSQFAH